MNIGGYLGKILRVDLSKGSTSVEELDRSFIEKWVGGVGFGAKFLYDEVPPGVEWSDPENRMIWASGPLAGSGVYGAGTFCIVTKGPMTNIAGSSQANGYFGAYLKFSGYDAIIFQGKAPSLVYLVLREGKAEIRDAGFLARKGTGEMEDLLRKELAAGEKDVSIYGIGPGGESCVLFASIIGDRGHAAAHNGLGAVMGSKNLKAVVAYRGKRNFAIIDQERMKEKNEALFEIAKVAGPIYKWGTGGGFSFVYNGGALPVKNYTTNIYPEHERMGGQYMRTHFEIRNKPCYMCPVAHCKEVTVTEGPYKGFTAEEPEYEQLAAWGPQIGNTELGGVVVLANEVDNLGIDCNESGWVIGWVMECYEKGIFSKDDLDGIDMTWGNVEAVKAMLRKIAAREGIGDLLSQGVMRASRKIGGEAADCAIYTMKGCTPRGHDHRGGGRWAELIDTCLTNTSTLESIRGPLQPEIAGLPPVKDVFSHEEMSTVNAKLNGIAQFEDCLGICRLASPDPKLLLECLNAVTGWSLSFQDIFTIGRRVINQLRMFNFRHGMKKEDERPSKRYGSIPTDGPAAGRNIMEKWDYIVENHYRLMGWDIKTGKPLPETLKEMGLEDLIKDL
ncbi:MAG TPA: aldehyde ferredoxin oxidoreductase C-terminal domain-containing protein [Syntrophorhabdaceae bacterium]|nr:aldehyde ferredoxin oxidoreductase C-terminal domain-containing protein [Syntrophorhabdaceae bacterium]HQM81603.1 aldehyde ferredoxin oxidoreductase C-terminal domain-containing protein [Syntrophorhabdaceae bacterium]